MVRSYAPKVQCINFNEGQDCFCVGLSSGLRVYNSEPLVEKLNLSSALVGSVRYCFLLQRTNLIAIVGGGPGSKFPENTLVIYDAASESFVLDITCADAVISAKLTHSRLAIVLQRQIHLFSFPDRPVKLATFETPDNFKGLCELSYTPLQEVIVFPGHRLGSVQVTDIKQISVGSSSSPTIINAHQNAIVCVTLNQSGTLLATASTKGTLIRIFNLEKKSTFAELRRGSDAASIFCIKFSVDSTYLVAASDKATVHVFAVKDLSLNRRSSFQKVGLPVAYAESQWDLARFSLPSESYCICGFGPNNQSVIAICKDGTFHKFLFNNDGSCHREGFDKFLEIGDDADFWNSYKIGR